MLESRALEVHDTAGALWLHLQGACAWLLSRWNDKLDDLSQEAVDKDLQETQKFLTRFEAIDTSGFPEQEGRHNIKGH
jgi:hypothetical protein